MFTSKKEKHLPAMNSLPGLLLTLTALSGEFPTALVSRLPGGDAYKVKVVKRLKKDKLLRTYYADGLRGLRLTISAKRLLLADWPEQFSPYLTGRSETNMLKSEVTRRLRLHRMTEVLVTMYNAGVLVFPWEKITVFGPTPPPDDAYIEQAAYYSSREVKEIGPQQDKIRGSRATGVLLAENGVFAVYNTGASDMKWERHAESRMKILHKMDLCMYRLHAQYRDVFHYQSAIVFGADMERMPVLMGVGGDQRRKYFVLEETYQSFHFLTLDRYGEFVLQLLTDPEEKEKLDDLFAGTVSEAKDDWIMINDGFQEDCPVLFAFTCDMPRIMTFAGGLDLHRLKGILYCFDFQGDVLRRVCGPRANIRCIDFEKYKKLM